MIFPKAWRTLFVFSLLALGLFTQASLSLPALAAPPEPLARDATVIVEQDGRRLVQADVAPPPPAFAPQSTLASDDALITAVSAVGEDICTPNTVVGVPTLLGPDDGAMTNSLSPMLRWQHDVNDARVVYYRVQVATSPDFAQTVYTIWYSTTGVPANQALAHQMFDNLLPDTLYYWRIVNQCGTPTSDTAGGTSAVRSFRTGANGVLLPAPLQNAPADGATVASINVMVEYSAVADATGYQVRFYRSPSSWEGQRHQLHMPTGTSTTATFTAGETIYWRVAARNAYGWGTPSAERSFLVSPTPFTDCTAVVGLPQSECEALVALYNNTAGPSWFTRSGWLTTDAPCTWYGITCINGHVTHIRLWQNNLGGSPPVTAAEQSVQAASAPDSGSLPTELGNLTHLQDLSLQDNHISGPLPVQLGNLTALRHLALWGNFLSGPIPPELGNLVNLQYLWLDENWLDGTIPAMLGNLTQLKQLNLWHNQLTGTIPSTLGNLTQLQILSLGNNQLNGAIPSELGNLASLQYLWLDSNQLGGAMPATLGNLTQLKGLGLWGNQLTGAIPSELGNLTNLQNLWLNYNSLDGTIPATLGNLTQLNGLDLWGNRLTGTIPSTLGNLTQLQILSLGNNQLNGAMPPELGNLASLQYLWLGGNALSGAIPPTLGNLTQLKGLELWRNQLTGTIPSTLGNLTQLTILSLTENQLSGPIPAELGNLANLTELRLWDNQLSGSIPPTLGNLTKLRKLQLSNNRLSGAIPAQLGALLQLELLDLGRNQLTGPLPTTLGQLVKLQQIFLQGNPGLVGPLPTSLTALTQLWEFYFGQTTLCEPTALAFQNWLHGIEVLSSTGVLCEATVQVRKKADSPRSTPNSVNGYTLVMRNPSPAAVTVTAIQDTLPTSFTYQAGSTTGVTMADPVINGQTLRWTGAFAIQANQEITLHFGVQVPAGQPQGIYLNSATVEATDAQGAPIVVQPATNVAPVEVPPPTVATNPGVTVPTGTATTDPATGEVNVTMPRGSRSDLTITTAVACPVPPGGSPTSVILHHGSYSVAMAENPAGSGLYVATIPATAVTTGPVAIAVTCVGQTITNEVAEVRLYDPSGIIRDANSGARIQDAKVTLYKVPGWQPDTATTTRDCRTVDTRGAGGWSQPAPTNLGVPADAALQPAEIDPALNPQYTNAEGRYGWNVVEGCWYVVVEKAGYVTKVSPVVGVPPEVTDLDLELTPLTTSTQIALQSGWNLVALGVVPTNSTASAVFGNITGSYDLAYAYNGCTAGNPWQKYNPSGPPFANTLTTLTVTQGLWVRATGNTTLTVNGANPANTAISLCVGWNLIAYPGNSPTPIATALNSITGQYDLVYAYNAAAANPWQKYNPSGPPFANSLTELRAGVGYWIRVTQATTLVVP